ncbi:hypothetical protein V9T40_006735 [Parthenolecanium corni]|uniref:Uncharacterized protein n=1 Tax=Parthenolecanium corni TaxID=536013 RepID=A0AAN9TTU0_9HEMI
MWQCLIAINYKVIRGNRTVVTMSEKALAAEILELAPKPHEPHAETVANYIGDCQPEVSECQLFVFFCFFFLKDVDANNFRRFIIEIDENENTNDGCA